MNKYVLFWYSKVIFKFQNENIKKYFRQLEITSKKLVTKELHLYFNENCVRDNLLPIYTNIYTGCLGKRGTKFHTHQRMAK